MLPVIPRIIFYLSLLYLILTVINCIIYYLSSPVSYSTCHTLYHALPVTPCTISYLSTPVAYPTYNPLYHILPVTLYIISYQSHPVSLLNCHPLYHSLPIREDVKIQRLQPPYSTASCSQFLYEKLYIAVECCSTLAAASGYEC